MKHLQRLKHLGFALLLSASCYGEDEIITIESTISGSQEQPKILVIVPWQKPKAMENLSTENQDDPALSNPFLQPLERRSFVQKNQLLQELLKQEP